MTLINYWRNDTLIPMQESSKIKIEILVVLLALRYPPYVNAIRVTSSLSICPSITMNRFATQIWHTRLKVTILRHDENYASPQ